MTLPTSAEGVSETRRARSVGTGRAHAKAIVLGEHAVVYGAAAIALPIPQLAVTASASWSSHTGGRPDELSYTVTSSPSGAMVTQASDGLRELTREFNRRMGVADGPHLDVLLDSTIPHGRGLGSSAAGARALVLALADLTGVELTEDAVFDLVQTAENRAHGRASGVDARTVGAPGPLLFHKGRATELSVGCDVLFLVADSGTPGSTKEAVGLLREGFRRRPGAQESFVGRVSELTEAGRLALAEGRPEALGTQLTDCHELLRAAGLSTGRIDALVEAALRAGSLGAKITGGGLGGCVIAQTRPERAGEVTRRLHEAGAVQIWVVPVRGEGSHAQ
ncbi:mevalonate kinase [Streptomyces sp. NPDC058092]|uniref:mevalonate kinase n=1 Tax=Streptomyces sp. NPDC058092 TaxID=3346336 RepID=UPI0036EA24C0